MTAPTDRLLMVVVGPTAVGKTALCVALAQHYGTEVVSADSRQFYRELRVGTARPTENEMQGVPHHFVGNLSVKEDYDVGQYEADALALLEDRFREHRRLVLTGGSGLYVRAVCEGLDTLPPVDPAVRTRVRALHAAEGLAALREQLRTLDPKYLDAADPHNPQRLMRALEICLSAGQPYSSFRRGAPTPRPFRTLKIGLTRARARLYARIDRRVDEMLAEGLEAEVRAQAAYRHHNALQTVGYREVFGYLDGAYDRTEMVRLLKRNTRRYAKRQLTWFRRDPAVRWFDLDALPDPLAAVTDYVATSQGA